MKLNKNKKYSKYGVNKLDIFAFNVYCLSQKERKNINKIIKKRKLKERKKQLKKKKKRIKKKRKKKTGKEIKKKNKKKTRTNDK